MAVAQRPAMLSEKSGSLLIHVDGICKIWISIYYDGWVLEFRLFVDLSCRSIGEMDASFQLGVNFPLSP
jgi:hypothetical protein